MISVGGTALQQATATGTRDATETAWEFATSGCSLFEPKQSWQQGSCPTRTSADVSAVADPNTPVWVYDTFTYGELPTWIQLGGTSVASPIVAAMIALAGGPSSAGTRPRSRRTHIPARFNDVTSGSTADCGNFLCEAGPGYDGPTGLGTPNGIAGFLPAAPGAPEHLRVGAYNGAFDLSWKPPAVNGGAEVTSYRIYRSDYGVTPIATIPASTPSFVDGGLTNGHAYSYQVTAVTAVGEGQPASVSVTPRPLDHAVVLPAGASIVAGGTEDFRVEGFAADGTDLGDLTPGSTFTIDPPGTCTAVSCGSESAGDLTVSATVYSGTPVATATTVLHVQPGPLAEVKVTPSKATIPRHGTMTFSAEGYDQYGNPIGDETPHVAFAIAPNGSCSGATCTAQAAGVHHVSATLPSASVALGWDGHSCAATSIAAECWGSNFYGQLGAGSFEDVDVPTPVAGLGHVTSISAGPGDTCAAAGGVSCWGFDAYGSLGNSASRSSALPLGVPGLTGVSRVSSNLSTCAIALGGALKCWGLNYFGQVGDGTTTDRWTPAAVSGLGSGVTDVSVGYLHACAVTAAGGAKCWGNNWDGELGNGTFGTGDCGCLFETPGDVSGWDARRSGGLGRPRAHVRADDGRWRQVLGRQPVRRARQRHDGHLRVPGRRPGPVERGDPARGRGRLHLRGDGGRRGQVLGARAGGRVGPGHAYHLAGGRRRARSRRRVRLGRLGGRLRRPGRRRRGRLLAGRHDRRRVTGSDADDGLDRRGSGGRQLRRSEGDR